MNKPNKPLRIYPRGDDGHKTFSIRIRNELVERMDEVVSQTGRTRNELVGLFLEYALDNCTVVSKDEPK